MSYELFLRKLRSSPGKINDLTLEAYFCYHTVVCVRACVRAHYGALPFFLNFFFIKFRPAVGQGQFSGYRELNSAPLTCWTVSCICILLSVHFGIPRGPYIKMLETLFCMRVIRIHKPVATNEMSLVPPSSPALHRNYLICLPQH